MDLRPKSCKEFVGCEVNKKLLLSVAKNGGPSTFLFAGDFGCGKTTMARLFSKMCLCKNLTDDICGECDTCKASFNNNPFYSEYDSSFFGNKEAITELYDELTFVPKGKKRVVCIDEAHLVTTQAQSALLKVFEDAPPNIYYILSTTDKDSILSTIVSRSLTLNFTTKTRDEVISNIKLIAANQNVTISDKVVNLIATRSKGHMRDAHKLYEKFLLIGEDDFLNLEESSYVYLAKYFAHVIWLVKNTRASADEVKKHKIVMNELVDRIMRIPIALVKDDYQKLFYDIARKSFDSDYDCEKIIADVVSRCDARSIMNLCKVALDDFTMSSFDSDIRFQTALLSIYQRLLTGV